MIRIAVADLTADSRHRIVEHLNDLLRSPDPGLHLVPHMSIRPVPLAELKCSPAPDICVVGEELVEREPSEIETIRRLFPEAHIVARLRSGALSISYLEELRRLGVDDILDDGASAKEFIRCIVFSSKRRAAKSPGAFILIESAKGGVGVTSVTAALGEYLSTIGKKVALVDLDTDTQDLSRFVGAKPFINEPLGLVLAGSRPATAEYVLDSLVKLDGEARLSCLPPSPDPDALADGRSASARNFLAALQLVDREHDVVLADAGSMTGGMLRELYRSADGVVFVTNNDPAGLHASVTKLKRLRSILPPDAKLALFENGSRPEGLSSPLLRRELSHLSGVSEEAWAAAATPWSVEGGRWPASGETMYSSGGRRAKFAIEQLAHTLGLSSEPEAVRDGSTKIGSWLKKLSELSFNTRKSVDDAPPAEVLLTLPETATPLKEAPLLQLRIPELRETTPDESAPWKRELRTEGGGDEEAPLVTRARFV